MSKKATKKSKKSVKDADINDPLHWTALTKLSSIHALRKILFFSSRTLPELSACCNIAIVRTHSGKEIGVLRDEFSDLDFARTDECLGIPSAMLPHDTKINKFVFNSGHNYEMDTLDDVWDLNKIFEDGAIEFSYDEAENKVYGENDDDNTYKSSFRVSIARIKRRAPIFDLSGKRIDHCDCLITLDSREADLYDLTENTIKKFTEDYKKILSDDPDPEIDDEVTDFYDEITNGVTPRGKYFSGLDDDGRHRTFRYILEVKVTVENPESLLLKFRGYELAHPKPTRVILLVKEIDGGTKKTLEEEGFPVHLWSKIDGLDELGETGADKKQLSQKA